MHGGAPIGGCALVVLLACAASAQAAPPSGCPAREQPVVLMLPPGGFIFDNSNGMPRVAKAARRAGFRPRYVDYPEFDLPGAVEAAERAARRLRSAGRPVYAYGESAGGTLAALLAQRGLVAAAATYSPVANLRRWVASADDPYYLAALIQADDRLQRRHSPGLHDSELPILALRPSRDQWFMNDATQKWDGRDPDVRSVSVPGGHLGNAALPDLYRANVERALAWLEHRTTLTEACSSRR